MNTCTGDADPVLSHYRVPPEMLLRRFTDVQSCFKAAVISVLHSQHVQSCPRLIILKNNHIISVTRGCDIVSKSCSVLRNCFCLMNCLNSLNYNIYTNVFTITAVAFLETISVRRWMSLRQTNFHNFNKKCELMLTRRAKAYSTSCSQTVSLSPAILSQFIFGVCSTVEDRRKFVLEMCLAAQNRQKSLKIPILAFKIIQGH